MLEQLNRLSSVLYAIFLFTYTDYKTIFFPVIVFASIAAPLQSYVHVLHGALWIWFHLLQCNISNQYKSVAEDRINRPWRPLPSGRLRAYDASVLRWVVLGMCLGISLTYGVDIFLVSICLALTTIAYDELRLAGHWAGKNICNVCGYVTFEIGATKIMGSRSDFDNVAFNALLTSALIILTTIQMQDFPDVLGDLVLKRRTIPIAFPRTSRLLTALCILGWSVILTLFWRTGPLVSIVILTLGASLSWRNFFMRTSDADARTYRLYNVWLLCAHLMPANARYSILAW